MANKLHTRFCVRFAACLDSWVYLFKIVEQVHDTVRGLKRCYEKTIQKLKQLKTFKNTIFVKIKLVLISIDL